MLYQPARAAAAPSAPSPGKRRTDGSASRMVPPPVSLKAIKILLAAAVLVRSPGATSSFLIVHGGGGASDGRRRRSRHCPCALNLSRAASEVAAARCQTVTTFMAGGGDFFDEISDRTDEGGGGGDENEGSPLPEDVSDFGDVAPAAVPSDPANRRRRVRPSPEEIADSEFEDRIPKLNVVTLSGRVGNDPDPRYFDDGKVVLNLSLAVRRKYHPLERKVRNIRSGEEETDWFPLEIWGRDAEYAAKYITKGARIGVTGSLIIDSWTDKNTGQPRSKPKILVKHLDILETRAEAELRKSNQGGGGAGQYYSRGGSNGESWSKGGRSSDRYGDIDDDAGHSPAGTGGFFD